MYLINAIVIATLYIFIRGVINNRDSRFKKLDDITLDEILENRNKKFTIKWKVILAEAVIFMTVVNLLWIAAFHSGFSEGREVVFVFTGIFLFLIAFFRMIHLVSMELRYDENYIYLKKGFSNIKLDLNKIESVSKLNAHLSVYTKERFFLCYIPTNFSHSHLVYKLIKDCVEIEKSSNYNKG